MVRDPNRLEDVFELIEKIRSDIRLYIGIKVFTSLLTALISYFVLNLVGVDFASFWAVLIFFLNFIPTIGSIIATTLPCLLALIQFETFSPFIGVTLCLITIQLIIGNIIEPKSMGRSFNLSGLVIILSLAFWGTVWGCAW